MNKSIIFIIWWMCFSSLLFFFGFPYDAVGPTNIYGCFGGLSYYSGCIKIILFYYDSILVF